MNINNLIKEEIGNLVSNKIREFLIKESELIRSSNLFNSDLNENNEEKRNEVISLIKNNEWEEQNPQSFKNSLLKSKHMEMLTDYDVSDLNKMKLFKLKNYNIGYALKDHDNNPYSEIVAVHNNEPEIKNIGDILMQSAIQNGGCYLDHFDSDKLSSLYSNSGFIEYGRDKYNPIYDPKGYFKSKYGELDVIYRKHSSCK